MYQNVIQYTVTKKTANLILIISLTQNIANKCLLCESGGSHSVDSEDSRLVGYDNVLGGHFPTWKLRLHLQAGNQ